MEIWLTMTILLNNSSLTAHGHEILTSPSPAALPSVQQPLPSPIFPRPAPGFHPSFDPKMLLAQQQPLLGINSHLGTMVPVQQPILQPFPTAFVQSSPYSLFPSHQVGSSTSYISSPSRLTLKTRSILRNWKNRIGSLNDNFRRGTSNLTRF